MSVVSTPCIRVCVLDPASGLCPGCGRTGSEIAAWSSMTEAERLAAMRTLPDRMAAAFGDRPEADDS